VPAVLVSADRSPDLAARAQAAGVTLLHKPIELHRLRAVLQWVKNASGRG
jgi:two-component system, sensor histidine kinase